ncbi:hypothetical protein PF010_g7632 [Phytophthora fragariae]|uniref:Uncharacterized protein n=2 Tax=Phytophthora fragariae TaxID=53985 RepID=A0A6A3ZNV8_9STRA|nr:hypothetical protein PF003_g4868 [Phytophthora fragariae]KAE9120065.1 hypothetical protein PF010_g7632 [Phytophthora fragariae]KAE9240510.1 hypothetical protein PF002_g9726 [Phytophthora fragariae]KAE9346939.1 hypothetical protein PF008_g8037 [Phytophthora fragariae]
MVKKSAVQRSRRTSCQPRRQNKSQWLYCHRERTIHQVMYHPMTTAWYAPGLALMASEIQDLTTMVANLQPTTSTPPTAAAHIASKCYQGWAVTVTFGQQQFFERIG